PLAGRSAQPDLPGTDRLDRQQLLRPRVFGEACPDGVLVRRVDDQERVLAVTVADGPTQDDQTLLGKPVHEARVLVPALLFAPGPGVIPERALAAFDQEVVRHGLRLRAGFNENPKTGRPLDLVFYCFITGSRTLASGRLHRCELPALRLPDLHPRDPQGRRRR